MGCGGSKRPKESVKEQSSLSVTSESSTGLALTLDDYSPPETPPALKQLTLCSSASSDKDKATASAVRLASAAPGARLSQTLENLAAMLVEIEPPYGVLRDGLGEGKRFKMTKSSVSNGLSFISTLEAITASHFAEMGTGRVFQALLAIACKSQMGPTVNMSISRDDRAGGARVSLKRLPGGMKAAKRLALKARKLTELLRVKVEDKDDLKLVERVLRDCNTFYTNLEKMCKAQKINASTALANIRERNDY